MKPQNIRFFGRLLAPCVILALACPLSGASAAVEGIKPEKVFTADTQKNKFYVKDGLIVGGDRNINEVIVLDVRHAMQAGYERLVLDLEGNREGESIAIERAPYYQVDVSPEMSRVVVTLWGKPKVTFDPKEVASRFKKSIAVRKVELLPILEKDRWTFVVHLKKGVPVEVFELANPVRIIMDLKTNT
jgi:hypothetical protein